MKNKSFTLIELLVVIVIIGILAGVIIVSTSSSISKANIAKVKVFENSIQNELGANMVSRWKLDEVIGTTTTPDAWGSNTGTLGDGATTSTYPTLKSESECVTGACMSFDGVDDYIEIADSQAMRMTQGGTITTWIYPKSVGEGSKGRIIDKAFYTLYIEPNMVTLNCNGTYTLSLSNSITFNQWQFVVATFNSSGRKIYINGIDVTRTGGSLTTLPPNVVGVVAIGNRPGATSHTFDGYIDDVRIYNGALSTSQIKQEYVAGLNSLLANNNISKEEYDQRIEKMSFSN